MLLVSTIVTLCVLLYSFGQGIVEFGRDAPLSVFHPTFLVLSAGVSNAFLSADLFNLFVGFEILLVSSYVLITLGGTERTHPRRARSTSSSAWSPRSCSWSRSPASTPRPAPSTSRSSSGGSPSCRPRSSHAAAAAAAHAFCIKAAVFPLSAWLPDSYPTAPAPVTAVFAGLLTKVGIYAIIRTQTLLFPDNDLRTLLLWAAVLTMVVGILGAVAQSDIKRILSFTLVSHIGYMLFGVAIGSTAGLSGAIFYIAHHITVQTTLFLVAGLIEYRSSTTNLDKLGGLARAAPMLSVLFFVPAMNLAGIPPFSGFLGKLALVQAGVADDRLAVVRRGGRRDRHEPADAVRDREGLEPGVLAARRGRRRSSGTTRTAARCTAARASRPRPSAPAPGRPTSSSGCRSGWSCRRCCWWASRSA